MIANDFQLHVSARKLLVVLIIALIPLTVTAIYTVTEAEQSGRETVGLRFATIAEISASAAAGYVHDRLVAINGLAHTPTVVAAVREANRRTQNESDAAFQARIEQTESIWNTEGSRSIVNTLLDIPVSRLFRQQIEADNRMLRVILTDLHGAVIAASHKTLDYYQGDEEPWLSAYADGRGGVYVSEVRFDEVTKRDFVYIAVPVVEPESIAFIGVLEVLIDVSRLLPQDRLPSNSGSFRRLLVTGEGRVVSGPNTMFSTDVIAPEMSSLRDAVAVLPGASGFIVSPIPQVGDELIGYADTGLGTDFPRLDLFVLVIQDAEEALASVSSLIRLIWIFALSAMALMTLAGAYFALHRKVHYEDISDALESEGQPPLA